jgi:hydroxymethylbilane synthase
MKKIRIGTRGSRLALWQARTIEDELRRIAPDVACEIVIVKTQGDRDKRSSLTQIGGLGVFTKEIETALLDDKIDIAVHSLKDLPSDMTAGLSLAAVPARGPVEDVLVSSRGVALRDLPKGAVVGTGSIRRRSQLLHLRPDLQMKDLRGNIDTRLQKIQEGEYDAIVMARAALVRLEMDDVLYSVFDRREVVPAVGQGAIGVQTRDGDEFVAVCVQPINHVPTFQAVTAERAFLHTLDSGCQFPVGAYASIDNDRLEIDGFVGSEDGTSVFIESHDGPSELPSEAGIELAERLIDLGALQLLKEYRDGKASS